MKYRCEICNRTFKTSQALASHKRNKHRELSKTETFEISEWIKSLNYWIKELDARISSVEEGLKLLGERVEKASFLIRCTFGNEGMLIYCPNCGKRTNLEYRKINGSGRWVCSVCEEIPF
ncbi:hypothetical protein DRP04_08935 [Archaeoglobales archaeon]|nr:MAG: hypothetical protein DRP04_08935 [Archaeoglobales archaeon]